MKHPNYVNSSREDYTMSLPSFVDFDQEVLQHLWDLPYRNFYKSAKRCSMSFQGGKKKAVNEDGGLQAPLVLCVEPLRALTDMQ